MSEKVGSMGPLSGKGALGSPSLVKSNASSVCNIVDKIIDRHKLKHYLPETSLGAVMICIADRILGDTMVRMGSYYKLRSRS